VVLGRRKQSVAGADYLIATAKHAADQGQPWAAEFADMVADVFIGDDLLLGPMIAKRPLEAHEASPVSIILSSMQMAESKKDHASAVEVRQLGLALLAKWPAYLCARVDGHPDFEFRSLEP
jgi:hypothetical protein